MTLHEVGTLPTEALGFTVSGVHTASTPPRRAISLVDPKTDATPHIAQAPSGRVIATGGFEGATYRRARRRTPCGVRLSGCGHLAPRSRAAPVGVLPQRVAEPQRVRRRVHEGPLTARGRPEPSCRGRPTRAARPPPRAPGDFGRFGARGCLAPWPTAGPSAGRNGYRDAAALAGQVLEWGRH